MIHMMSRMMRQRIRMTLASRTAKIIKIKLLSIQRKRMMLRTARKGTTHQDQTEELVVRKCAATIRRGHAGMEYLEKDAQMLTLNPVASYSSMEIKAHMDVHRAERPVTASIPKCAQALYLRGSVSRPTVPYGMFLGPRCLLKILKTIQQMLLGRPTLENEITRLLLKALLRKQVQLIF